MAYILWYIYFYLGTVSVAYILWYIFFYLGTVSVAYILWYIFFYLGTVSVLYILVFVTVKAVKWGPHLHFNVPVWQRPSKCNDDILLWCFINWQPYLKGQYRKYAIFIGLKCLTPGFVQTGINITSVATIMVCRK